MKCEGCGSVNPESMKFCGNCGRPLVVPAVVPSDSRSRNCVACGRPIGWDAAICMYCGHDYRGQPKKGTEGYLLTGAVLTLLAGILGIAILIATLQNWEWDAFVTEPIRTLSFCCGILGIIGGYAALGRKRFPIAVLGAGAAIFTPAFFLAVPGLVLIVQSATRFKDYEEKK